ncbi:MAG: hypothetical protein J6B12_05550, partial [Clostridia bacterium]|nr:hypothetical protein [Clostridia bacterium]
MKKNRFLCILFALLLLLPSALITVLPQKSFLETEKRMLAALPTFSLESVTDGSFSAGLGKCYADRFPLRNLFLKSKSTCELLLGKRQNGDVLFGKDLYQIKRLEACNIEILTQNKQAAENVSAHLRAANQPVVTLYAPRVIDVLLAKLPKGYPQEASLAPWTVLPRSPLIDTLTDKATRGEAVWYRTDHHWTS